MDIRHARMMARQLLPGVFLPGLIYFSVSRMAPVLVALAVASSIPLLDAVYRLLRRRPQSVVGLVFLVLTCTSVGLAFWLRSPLFIVAKGAVTTAIVGAAFGISALIRRPLTRTLAVTLSSDHGETREALRRRWAHPSAIAVFCTLSAGWGVLLLASAAQQAALAFTVSPGTVMAVEPGVQLTATLVGVAASVAYVRRRQRSSPELRLLPVSS
jgi:hypothetical protein